MYLSIAALGPHASDLGFMLYKHPDRLFEKTTPKGRILGFFPENLPDRAEFVLCVEVDPVERVRGVNWDKGISSYVEPMPYLAASHMSQAISQALGSALNGVIGSKDPEVDARLRSRGGEPWKLEIKVGPVRCGTRMISRLFGSLGWEVATETHELSVPGAEENRPLHVFSLSGDATLATALAQLYVLLPVLDPDRHYFYDESEARKLFDKGGDWLRLHPDRDLIVNRYLSRSRELREYARSLFGDVTEHLDDARMEEIQAEAEEHFHSGSPHERRHDRIVGDITAWGARTVADLGCGEGRLIERLVRIAPDMRVVGVEPSSRDLDKARKKLSANPGRNLDPRVELIHGSAIYADGRLKGFDTAVLSEVVEHIDPDRLSLLARSVFGVMRPAKVIVTTPNGDYNDYFGLLPGEFRHSDHRFEWSRAECEAWVADVCAVYGYDAQVSAAGGRALDAEERHGEISHYIVFTRKDG